MNIVRTQSILSIIQCTENKNCNNIQYSKNQKAENSLEKCFIESKSVTNSNSWLCVFSPNTANYSHVDLQLNRNNGNQ